MLRNIFQRNWINSLTFYFSFKIHFNIIPLPQVFVFHILLSQSFFSLVLLSLKIPLTSSIRRDTPLKPKTTVKWITNHHVPHFVLILTQSLITSRFWSPWLWTNRPGSCLHFPTGFKTEVTGLGSRPHSANMEVQNQCSFISISLAPKWYYS